MANSTSVDNAINKNDHNSSNKTNEEEDEEASSNKNKTEAEKLDELNVVPTVIVDEKTDSSLPNSDTPDDGAHDGQHEDGRFLVKATNVPGQHSITPTPTDVASCGGESLEDNILPDADFQSTLSVSEYPDGFRAETIVDHLPVPPDGGYGWVIVGASFVSNLIVDGIANSFGPFMAPYQETFQSSKAITSFIGSLLVGAYLLSGPLAGGLLNKYKARRVVIVGTLLSSVSFVFSTFSPNVATHCVFYGLLGGTGFAFIYLPAIVTVSQYFERRRALATGISVAGSGVGTFIMPLLCRYFIEVFNWKITLYILAAILLICALCGLFYKPLPVPEDQIQLNDELKQQALFAALSRADFSDDDNTSRSSRCTNEDNPDDTNPFKRGARQTNSQCTSRTTQQRSTEDDGLPLINSMEKAPSHDDDKSGDNIEDNVGGGRTGSPPLAQPVAQIARPTQLSPITENRNGGVTNLLNRGSRAGSQHYYHYHHSPAAPTAELAARLPPVIRNRKTTLTSINSEFTSLANGIDFRQSRPNLTNQLSRISARSYAQSLSRISQGPQSIRAGDSILSVALSGVDPKEFNRPMSRRDVFLQGSIKNLKEFEDEGCNYKAYREHHSVSIPASVVAQSLTKLQMAGGPLAHVHGDIAELSSRMGGSRYSRITGGFATEEEELAAALVDERKHFCSKFKWIPYPIRNAFGEMIDVSLLREPVMLLLCLSNMLGMVGFYVPFVFIMELAVEKNVDTSRATLLLSIIGITNTFGRVLFGWMADRQWVSALVLNNFSLIACGLLTVICPFAPDFLWLTIYAALFGFIISAYICLTSIVLSDLLGVERLTNSFGLLVVSRGIASLVGTPVAGIVYDAMHSYNASFYFSGCLIMLSGLTSCFIPMLHRYERSKLKNEGEYHLRAKGTGTGADPDVEAQSGKLSVLTERSEENLTEYQRTIQSIAQQKQLIREMEEYKVQKRANKNSASKAEQKGNAESGNGSPKHLNGNASKSSMEKTKQTNNTKETETKETDVGNAKESELNTQNS